MKNCLPVSRSIPDHEFSAITLDLRKDPDILQAVNIWGAQSHEEREAGMNARAEESSSEAAYSPT